MTAEPGASGVGADAGCSLSWWKWNGSSEYWPPRSDKALRLAKAVHTEHVTAPGDALATAARRSSAVNGPRWRQPACSGGPVPMGRPGCRAGRHRRSPPRPQGRRSGDANRRGHGRVRSWSDGRRASGSGDRRGPAGCGREHRRAPRRARRGPPGRNPEPDRPETAGRRQAGRGWHADFRRRCGPAARRRVQGGGLLGPTGGPARCRSVAV